MTENFSVENTSADRLHPRKNKCFLPKIFMSLLPSDLIQSTVQYVRIMVLLSYRSRENITVRSHSRDFTVYFLPMSPAARADVT